MLNKLWFVVKQRFRGSRISPAARLKTLASIRMGERCKIHQAADLDASLGPGVTLGDRVSIGRGAMVQGSRGGVSIGDGSEVNNYAVINGTGGVRIGADVMIGPHACIISYAHIFEKKDVPIREQGYRNAGIVIEDDVWIGAHAVLLAGITVGRGAVVGAGSVVTRDVAPYAVVAGAPAALLRWRGEQRTQ